MSEQIFGVMLDVSRNGVMKVNKVKQFIDYLSLMGYNTLELYSEDMYEVKELPELGYFRGPYTEDELIELDEYASSKGIELIPCIQTLAHFTNFRKTKKGKEFLDCDDILLVDDDKTYYLIDLLFKTCSKCFKSRKINIGMDEAHNIGLGRYLDKNGYVNRQEILLSHLAKVSEIAKKYGYKCHMWSDMFVRLANHGEYYIDNNPDVKIDESIKNKIPKNINIAYWDYYSVSEEHYKLHINMHRKLDDNFYFAGGIHSWVGFSPANQYSINCLLPAMKACKESKVNNILLTMWGDCGKECSFFNLLPSLFAASEFHKGNYDINLIKQKFNELFSLDFDDFLLLDSCSFFKDTKHDDFFQIINRGPVYNDPFVPMLDVALSKHEHIDYLEASRKLNALSKKYQNFKYLFDVQSSLAYFLHYKFDLSKLLRQSYQENDKDKLKQLCSRIRKSIEALDTFKENFYTAYLEDNKSFGIEIHNIRLGGLKERLLFCEKMIKQYCSGKINSIDELSVNLIETEDVLSNYYQWINSPSEI